MKQALYILLSFAILLPFVGCNNNTYSTELQAEKDLITDFIARQGIRVIEQDSCPTEWGEKDYWKVPSLDYYYFHLVSPGDTATDEIEYKDRVNIRYREYTLDVYADTVNMWNTNDASFPIELQYGVSTDASCSGWQYALKYMKYTKAECKIICPSKLGFNSSDVVPYGYDMKMQIRRY